MIRPIFHVATMVALAWPLGVQAQAVDVIEQASRYTVKIITAVDYPFGSDKKGTGIGSGFLIDKERGWLLTNAHVVRKSPSTIRVSFKDQPFSAAEKVHVDNHLDLAIIRIDPKRIPERALEAKLKCDGESQAGAPVIAFGHPWRLDFTATRGIVSGTKSLDGEEKLQTDAALNPGNSGGPLIDVESGRIVGVNSSTLSKNVSEGLNFAVPAPLVCRIVDLLKAGRDPAPPRLPVIFATSGRERELIIAEAKDGWADKLKPGDRILAVNGDENARFASRVISHARGEQKLFVAIMRNGKKENVELPVPPELDSIRRKGIHVSGMVVSRSTNADYDPSVMWVHFVDDASIAEQSLISEGDQLGAVDGQKVKNQEEVLAAFSKADGKEVELIIRRPKFSMISGRFDYLVRKLDVTDVREVGEQTRVR